MADKDVEPAPKKRRVPTSKAVIDEEDQNAVGPSKHRPTHECTQASRVM
jgi:hypothetical protein